MGLSKFKDKTEVVFLSRKLFGGLSIYDASTKYVGQVRNWLQCNAGIEGRQYEVDGCVERGRVVLHGEEKRLGVED